MKTTPKHIIVLTLLSASAGLFSSCASFEHPLARHDMDGDRAISHAEYQQQQMQYHLAGIQRDDEYSRARLVTHHVSNVGDLVGQADRVVNLLGNFGH